LLTARKLAGLAIERDGQLTQSSFGVALIEAQI
jgi:hypothetical protein